MENSNIIAGNKLFTDDNIRSMHIHESGQSDIIEGNNLFEKFAEESSADFYNYLSVTGLAKDADLVILSPNHHYYYEAGEFERVKTLVNLKLMNNIKQLTGFFTTVYNILPSGGYFTGCFSDKKNPGRFISDSYKTQSRVREGFDPVEFGIYSKYPFLNRIYNFMDFRAISYLTKGTVTILLEEALLNLLDMTEINSLIYFYAQKA